MHFSQVELDTINKQFQDRLLACVNSAPRRKREAFIDNVSISLIVGYGRYGQDGYYIRIEDEIAAQFFLSTLHGCCGVCVSYCANVSFKYRGSGLGKLLNEIRIEMARQMQYGLLICTDVTTNVAQTKILDSVGWAKATDFLNPKTVHTVNLHYIKL